MFHSGNNRSKISSLINDVTGVQTNLFGSYYGKAVLHFLEPMSSTNKDLSVALLYSLGEWLCYPKNARNKQN